MNPGWTLVEPCAGTAALSLHLLGARRQLVPRQGSKWALRAPLSALAERLGFTGPPSRIVLSDASPWAIVVREVLEHRVLDALRPLVEEGGRDPRALHDRLHGAPIPVRHAELAAELLWLQRMAYAGKAVRVVGGCWSSPGLNLTSVYGVGGTERFGAVRPLGPALLRAVASAPHADVEGGLGLARPTGSAARTLVYIDPPYARTEGYGATLPRPDVVALAEEWATAGAVVVVSEATAVEELVAKGWYATALGTEGGQPAGQLFRRHHRGEWVTWSAEPVQLGLFAGRAA